MQPRKGGRVSTGAVLFYFTLYGAAAGSFCRMYNQGMLIVLSFIGFPTTTLLCNTNVSCTHCQCCDTRLCPEQSFLLCALHSYLFWKLLLSCHHAFNLSDRWNVPTSCVVNLIPSSMKFRYTFFFPLCYVFVVSDGRCISVLQGI